MLRTVALVITLWAILSISRSVLAQPMNDYQRVADQLAEQLVKQMQRHHVDDGYSHLGLTRWVMADTLQLPHPQDSVASLSHQLSESLYKYLQKRNVRLIDYRAQDHVSLASDGATLLTREVEHLDTQPLLDWVLVGTMAQEDQGVIVNLRVLERSSQKVLASANSWVPKHLYWTNRRSEIVDGKLQRNY